jgi:capsular exopolysaccharide synthesis family protein
MDINKENIQMNISDNDTLNIRDEIEKYLVYWKWFLLFTVLSVSMAFLYLRYATPQYSATTTILIKDNNKSGISTELAAFEDLGIVGGSSSNNPDNEIEILKSRRVIGRVIDSLNFDVSYFVEGRLKLIEVYKRSPVLFTFLKKDTGLFLKGAMITLLIGEDNSFSIKDAKGVFFIKGNFNELLESELGFFKVVRNPKMGAKDIVGKEVIIKITPKNSLINSYKGRLTIASVDKNSSIIKLSLTDAVSEKSKDFLNELVRQYNIDAIIDKNEISSKTKDFIHNRLKSVGKELAVVQDHIKDFKRKTGFIGVSDEGALILESLAINNADIFALETQIKLSKWIEKRISSQSSKEELLPTNLGFENVSITTAITNYNELIMSRNRLVSNAGEKNPQLIELQKQIINIKLNLKQNLKNLTTSLQLQYEELKKEQSRISSKQATIPIIERGYIDIARQQEIIASLYSYLLKKKEEIAISLAVSVTNAKIIDVAYGSNSPVAPKRQIIYLSALLLGVLIPFIVLYLKHLLNTKIHTRKDIEDLTTIPFIGDIPHSNSDSKIVIENDSRTSVAEAFRLIRTNLDFMLPNKADASGKTIFITSTTSGEGKSFVSINLAVALSISNKKVLLLGMDLRAPKVIKYLGLPERKGVVNYITNNELNLSDIRFSIPTIKGLDIISSGVIPPNPAELLLHPRVQGLFNEVKNDYDFIIVDTAPVTLVTDTLLVSKYADMTLYVTRANFLDKRMLNVVQTLYREKKLTNMAIVLNDTKMTRGYGYSYGYSYDEEVKKPWYKEIFK